MKTGNQIRNTERQIHRLPAGKPIGTKEIEETEKVLVFGMIIDRPPEIGILVTHNNHNHNHYQGGIVIMAVYQWAVVVVTLPEEAILVIMIITVMIIMMSQQEKEKETLI
jgi:hypothetical protein